MHAASARLREKVFAIAANLLECAPADLELRRGVVGVVGVPDAEVSLAAVAKAARPGWESARPPGVEPGLEEIAYWQPETVTWSYAVHVAIVEVDRDTGRVSIDGYAVAHDCGVWSSRCWSRARSWAAPRTGWVASSAKGSPTMPTANC
jgi:carbon-monoxide dehydrogenase large subunit